MWIRRLPIVGLALMLGAAAPGFPSDDPKPAGGPIEIRGALEHGVQVIGGETTGTVVTTAERKTFELDLKGKKDLIELVERLDGKRVFVRGTLTIRKGVEVPERRIIAVTVLRSAEGDERP